jgi:hypothetical protein
VRGVAATLALLALAACGESPDPGYLLKRQRVVGAITTVEGDEARTTPRPGETVRMEWLTIAPEPVEPTTWLIIACTPSDQAFGVPVCGAAPFEIFSQVEPVDAQPSFEIEVPADYEAEQVVLLGAICMGGVVSTDIDPMAGTENLRACRDDEGTGEIVSATITVEQRPELRNLRPGLMALSLRGEELTEDPPEARVACAGGSLPEVSLDEEAMLTITPVPDSRETYVDQILEEETIEELQNSLFVTEGTLNRRFTFVDDDDPEPEVEFLAEPDPDDPLPAEGRTVKLIVVMRDRRGGVDALSRGFCLVP